MQVGQKIKAAKGDFDIELDIEDEATGYAKAVHRESGKAYGVPIARGSLGEQQPQPDELAEAARAAVLRVAGTNGMLVTLSVATAPPSAATSITAVGGGLAP